MVAGRRRKKKKKRKQENTSRTQNQSRKKAKQPNQRTRVGVRRASREGEERRAYVGRWEDRNRKEDRVTVNNVKTEKRHIWRNGTSKEKHNGTTSKHKSAAIRQEVHAARRQSKATFDIFKARECMVQRCGRTCRKDNSKRKNSAKRRRGSSKMQKTGARRLNKLTNAEQWEWRDAKN